MMKLAENPNVHTVTQLNNRVSSYLEKKYHKKFEPTRFFNKVYKGKATLKDFNYLNKCMNSIGINIDLDIVSPINYLIKYNNFKDYSKIEYSNIKDKLCKEKLWLAKIKLL